MRNILFLFFIYIAVLTSCSSGHPPINIPEGFFDSTASAQAQQYIYDPYEIDSICKFHRVKDGELIGEWMEMGDVNAIVSEVDCFSIDTNGFATRRQARWVIRNDSTIETYGRDVEVNSGETHMIISGDNGQVWSYEKRGITDTIFMSDFDHGWHDTLRIVRLEADTLILGSVMHKWAFRPPEVKSVLYFRRR
jgi:hypothetical protein